MTSQTPYEEFVPYSTSFEGVMIFSAVMLRSPFRLVHTAYRETKLMEWEKTPRMRAIDHHRNSTFDLLGSVSDMVSGYPERAEGFVQKELAVLRAEALWALYEDDLALQEAR